MYFKAYILNYAIIIYSLTSQRDFQPSLLLQIQFVLLWYLVNWSPIFAVCTNTRLLFLLSIVFSVCECVWIMWKWIMIELRAHPLREMLISKWVTKIAPHGEVKATSRRWIYLNSFLSFEVLINKKNFPMQHSNALWRIVDLPEMKVNRSILNTASLNKD